MKKINNTVVLITLGTVIGIGLVVYSNINKQEDVEPGMVETVSKVETTQKVSTVSETNKPTIKLTQTSEKERPTITLKSTGLTELQKEVLTKYEDALQRNKGSLAFNSVILLLVNDKIDEINKSLVWNDGYRSQSQYDDFSKWLKKTLDTQLALEVSYQKYLIKSIDTQKSAQEKFGNDMSNIKNITDPTLLDKYLAALQEYEQGLKTMETNLKKFSDETSKLQTFIEGQLAGMSNYQAPTKIECRTGTNFWGQLITICS